MPRASCGRPPPPQIRGYNCEWVEQAADSLVFGHMVGCPWWVGLLASGFAMLPNHEATKTVMSSENKLRVRARLVLYHAARARLFVWLID